MPPTDADLKRLLRRMVVVTFDDHASGGKTPFQCWAVGWLMRYTEREITLCVWLTARKAEDTKDHYAVVRGAITAIEELKEV